MNTERKEIHILFIMVDFKKVQNYNEEISKKSGVFEKNP